MTAKWRVMLGGADSARDQMALDAALAQEGRLTARIFLWPKPAVSLGLKQARPAWLETAPWTGSGCESVVRPTGGGLAVHGSDVSLSVVVPREAGLSLRQLMATAGASAAALCRSYGARADSIVDAEAPGRVTVCLAEPSPYAVTVGGRKIAGFALRRYPESWLIQGSLLVAPLPPALSRALPGTMVRELAARSVPLSQAAGQAIQPGHAAARWAREWAAWWDDRLMDTLMQPSCCEERRDAV